MPAFVEPNACNACAGEHLGPLCVYICPNDLMVLNKEEMKAYNQEPDQCWECYSCVKICPQGAIEVRHYADLAPMGGYVQPMRGTDSIMWTIKFRNGNVKRFKFPIRTTPEGSIKPYDGKPSPGADQLDNGLLFTEPADSPRAACKPSDFD